MNPYVAPQLTRINREYIYPPLLARVEVMLERLNRRGYRYVATRGWDSFATQDEIYAQGRTKPGLIVTHAKGGESQHNFGLALDFVFDADADKPGVQPSWEVQHYLPLASECLKAGLHTGRDYKDYPHVGWGSVFISGPQLMTLAHTYRTHQGTELDRLRYVWDFVDRASAKLPSY